jgi:hypothetical protein
VKNVSFCSALVTSFSDLCWHVCASLCAARCWFGLADHLAHISSSFLLQVRMSNIERSVGLSAAQLGVAPVSGSGSIGFGFAPGERKIQTGTQVRWMLI